MQNIGKIASAHEIDCHSERRKANWQVRQTTEGIIQPDDRFLSSPRLLQAEQNISLKESSRQEEKVRKRKIG